MAAIFWGVGTILEWCRCASRARPLNGGCHVADESMRDRLINSFCGVCLLLCFTVIVSWARSNVSSESMILGNGYTRYYLVASEGELMFARGKLVFDSSDIEQAWRSVADPDNTVFLNRWRFAWSREQASFGPINGSVLGFGYQAIVVDTMRRVMMSGVRTHRLVIEAPHWAVALLFGVGPGWWLYRRHRASHARLDQGLCRKCGFEMGNVYHSCPKCGTRAPLPEGFPVMETK